MTMDELHTHASDLAAWLDSLPDGPLPESQIEEAMIRMVAAYDREVAREARVLTTEEAARLHAIAAKAIKEEEAMRQQADQAERQVGEEAMRQQTIVAQLTAAQWANAAHRAAARHQARTLLPSQSAMAHRPLPQSLINAFAAMVHTLYDAGVDSDAVIAQCRVIAARAIAAGAHQTPGERTLRTESAQDAPAPVTVDFPGRMEPPESHEQNVHIWIAACDHLASLTNAAFADWIEDEVFVQFPIQTPMSDILSEVIDRLRRLSEESAS
jgi:hypothetical protein